MELIAEGCKKQSVLTRTRPKLDNTERIGCDSEARTPSKKGALNSFGGSSFGCRT